MKIGEVKGKRGKERYTHLNAEFQRIAMRVKLAGVDSMLLAASIPVATYWGAGGAVLWLTNVKTFPLKLLENDF